MSNVAIVTGASAGVGLEIAKHLCSNGVHVLAVARRLDLLQERLSQYSGKFTAFYCDLSDLSQVASLGKELSAQYRVTILINNAAVLPVGPCHETSQDCLSQITNINCLSPVMLMSQLIPSMRIKGFGRIINVTSGAPLNCFSNYGLYSATKAFLNAITVSASKENSDMNVKINLMSPGPVKTEMSPDATIDPSVCLPTLDYLLDPKLDAPTGIFMWLGYQVPLIPDLEGVDWLSGNDGGKLLKLLP